MMAIMYLISLYVVWVLFRGSDDGHHVSHLSVCSLVFFSEVLMTAVMYLTFLYVVWVLFIGSDDGHHAAMVIEWKQNLIQTRIPLSLFNTHIPDYIKDIIFNFRYFHTWHTHCLTYTHTHTHTHIYISVSYTHLTLPTRRTV